MDRYAKAHPPAWGRTCRTLWNRLFYALLALILAGAVTFAALLGAVVLGDTTQIHGSPQVMIVLGCQLREDGPSQLLRDRLDAALGYWQAHPEGTILLSGGQGPNEPVSEAQGMADYLAAHGVPRGQMLLEEQSRNTWQNLLYSWETLEAAGLDPRQEVVLVSNGFHLARARLLWERVRRQAGGTSTLSAPSSHTAARIWMYIREPAALLKSFLFDRR